MGKIKVYVVARIAREVHAWTDTVCGPLESDNSFDVFKPKNFNPWWLPPSQIPGAVVEMDVSKIVQSHIGLVLPEYGHDCAWETGHYMGSGKPLVVFVDHQLHWLNEHGWLVWVLNERGFKAGSVVTCNPTTYGILKSEPRLASAELRLLTDLEGLPQYMKEVYRSSYEKAG